MTLAKSAAAPRVLVIYKKSAYQLYVRERRSARIVGLIAVGDPVVQRLRRAHEDHVATIALARRTLAALGVRAVFRFRSDLRCTEDFDLVLTLGGDGTLLWASHIVGRATPMLAINTAPRDSVGFFCAAGPRELGDVIADALRGRARATELTRMRVDCDGVTVSHRVLNDALFCHACPAATSRYIAVHGRVSEEQKSSGMWVGPAAGSTAAQRSAGGRVLPLDSPCIQFVVREPYEPTGVSYRLRRGVVAPGGVLELRSKIRDGRLYLDGPHVGHAVDFGSVARMLASDEPLTLLGLRGKPGPPGKRSLSTAP